MAMEGHPSLGGHEEQGQHWISRTDVEWLRHYLRYDCRAEVIETNYRGPLPALFLLELESSQNPLERALFTLFVVIPEERWRTMVRRLAAYAHPDGVTGRRPVAADTMLKVCYALLDDPELPRH
jgi:hypothetical protein